MVKTHKSQCPLCDSPASFEYHDSNQFQYVDCDNCGNFAISRRALVELNKHPHRKKKIIDFLINNPSDDKILEITFDITEGVRKVFVQKSKYL